MGVSHSQDRAAFFNADAPWDDDQVDIARCIWRFESKLWRVAPPWAPLLDGKEGGEGAAASPRSSQRAEGIAVEPWKKLVILYEALNDDTCAPNTAAVMPWTVSRAS